MRRWRTQATLTLGLLAALVASRAALSAGGGADRAVGADPAAVVAAPAADQAAPTLVVLVRHAEKLDGDDPGLSPAGEARARALAHVLSRWTVDAIYTSEFRRTRDTATPLARSTGVTPEIIGARDMDSLLERIRSGGHHAIVVIGHSNTVPAIARGLGAEGVTDIPEDTYDDMLVVRLDASGEATLMHLKYGLPTP